jgi:hypothetical protein
MENTLLQANATLPQYDRDSLKPRIVHLGFGAFHRAHQAVYADILAAEHGSDWGYCEVNLIGGEQQIADLNAQDNLYRGGDVCRCVDIPRGWRGKKRCMRRLTGWRPCWRCANRRWRLSR